MWGYAGKIRRRLLCSFALVALLFSLQLQADESRCAGFPKLGVSTPAGSCVGIIYSGAPLRLPRRIVQIPHKQEFLITDVGSWQIPNQGRVWWLRFQHNGQPEISAVFEGLRFPHGISVGPDNKIYLSEQFRISRFNPQNLRMGNVELETVISDLPNSDSLHPMRQFVFGNSIRDRWDFYVNIGSSGDACLEDLDANGHCRLENSEGLLLRYLYQGNATWVSQPQIFARGLRNSMGLASHPSGTLLQLDNARNNNELLSDPNEPFDELNLVEPGRHYGWPYCINFAGTGPEWQGSTNFDCGAPEWARPWVLLPPHSAPLEAMYYQGDRFPFLKNRLLISLHGVSYGTGHRLISLQVDSLGRPLSSLGTFTWPFTDSTGQEMLLTSEPAGGLLRHSWIEEIIGSWHAIPGVRDRGAPVGLLEDDSGRVWIIDDRNRSILRLDSGTPAVPPEMPAPVLPEVIVRTVENSAELLRSWQLLRNSSLRRCQNCHNLGLRDLFERTHWFDWNNPSESLFIRSLEGRSPRPMPPYGRLSAEEIDLIRTWLREIREALPGARRASALN